jgi:thioredoxin reductase/Pyruvate/2-oxoacid:ferredoxin oxidoreductase delta subunit
MNMTTVTLAFVALTALLIWRHLRAELKRRAGRPSGATRVCPRCSAMVSTDARRCTNCGVPLQAFEVLNAPTAAATGATGAPGTSDSGEAPLRAHVRMDICVGCGACAHACPEPGAITVRNKLAIVDAALCKGHGECVEACPVQAVTLSRGAAANRVVVPALDAHFQTNVPGLYIVGELGGRGLIKNAINEGRIAIEHVAATRAPHPVDDEVFDVAIVGAGPAGLSAGLEAVRLRLRYVVLEQGSIADSVRKYPRHKLLLAEPVNIPIYGKLWVADASKEALLQVWEKAVERAGLSVLTGRRVEAIERAEHALIVKIADGSRFLARTVLLAMGRRGTPRRLGVTGEDSAKVVYDIAEMEEFKGRRVLVVGGGDSAIESAVGLAQQPDTSVTLSYRKAAFDRVKARNKEKLDALVATQRVSLLLNSQVKEIRDDVVLLDVAGQPTILPNDDVVVRIGGNPPQAMLDRIGVRMVEKDLGLPNAQALGA